MGWLTSILEKRVTSDHARELDQFIGALSTMSDGEISELVAYATHTRHLIERLGVDLIAPSVPFTHPDLLPQLIKRINAFHSQGNTIAASSMMIWAHTIRATTRPQLKHLGSAMWRELSRGFPGVDQAAASIAARTDQNLDICGSNKVPLMLDHDVAGLRS